MAENGANSLSDAGQAILEAIEGLKSTVQGLDSRVQGLDSRLSDLERKMNTWPDLHFLQAAAQRQIGEAREARDHRRHIEIKLDEIYGSMATSSEIAKLRDEVAKSIDREDALDLRVATIESRLGIKNPLVPTE